MRRGGVATSGRDYRHWQRAGQAQHHIIDPRSGRPAAAAAAAKQRQPAKVADPEEQAMSPYTLMAILLGAAGGAVLAAVVLPAWAPGLSTSLLGSEVRVYWYLARSSAMVAYVLVWLSMMMGLLITSRSARIWPGGPAAFDIHQHSALLGLAFALFHALILLGDSYASLSLAELFVPFLNSEYLLALSLGQATFYLLLLVSLSFYVRSFIGRNAWRAIHLASFLLFSLALAHGISAGSDSGSGWAQAIYWSTGGSLLFLTIYRVLHTGIGKRPAAAR